jgi:hypothetical protein
MLKVNTIEFGDRVYRGACIQEEEEKILPVLINIHSTLFIVELFCIYCT